MAGHDHGTSESERTSSRTLGLVALINFVGFVIELAGGLLFGSVALLSDAMHMLFDMLAYAMAFAASYTAERYEKQDEWSYGLHRLEPVAAFLNGVLLIPMVGYIVYEAYQRFIDPIQIDPVYTIVVATGGLLINIASVYVLQGREMSLNEEGAFYHLIGDTGASIAVIISTAVVAIADIRVVDPITAILIAIVVLWSSVRVLRGSTAILLERSPVDLGEVEAAIRELDGVKTVDDLHAWQICSQLTVASVRVTETTRSLEHHRELRAQIHERLNEFDVDHATVELVEPSAEIEQGSLSH